MDQSRSASAEDKHGGPGLAVVVPARNEAARLPACLGSLEPFRAAGDRVLVVDAASEDGTGALARALGFEVLRRPGPERGFAVAAGYAEVAPRVEAVLIAHADMILPARARGAITAALAGHPDAVGGALGHVIEDPRWRFRLVEWGNRVRAGWGQLPYGDQAQFVRTRAVEQAGGFPWMPWLEDLELALRLRRLGPWLYLDCPVRIPARHWAGGLVRATLRNWAVALGYRLRRASRREDRRAAKRSQNPSGEVAPLWHDGTGPSEGGRRR